MQQFVQTNQTGYNTSAVLTSFGSTATQYFPPASNVQATATNKIGYVVVPGSNVANGKRFSVRATGNFEVGGNVGCPSFHLGLYGVTFDSNGASPAIISTAAASQIGTGQNAYNTFYPWALRADFVGDSNSGLLQNLGGWTCIDGVAASVTAGLVTGFSKLNFANSTPLGFVVGISFGVVETGNNSTMTQFALTL